MAPIYDSKSDLFMDQATKVLAPDPNRVAGVLRVATGTLATAVDALNGSTYLLAKLPSQAILHPDTFFDVENYGFAAVRIGTSTDAGALVSVLKSAGNSVTPIAWGDTNHGKPLWEVLGMSSDPGGEIGIYATAVADATGAGTMPFAIAWLANS